MISTLEKKIIFRYLKTRKKDGFLNIITLFSFLGISLGVAVLIIVMSVMNGFRSELINKITNFNAHVIVKPYGKKIEQKKIDNEFLQNISSNLILSNNGEGILLNDEITKGILVRGYSENDFQKLNIVNNKYFRGDKKILENNISIGSDLSYDLELKIGDRISIISPSGENTLIGSIPRQKAFKISSIFDSRFAEFNNSVVFINLKDLQGLFDLKKEKNFLEVYLYKPDKIEIYREKLMSIFTDEYIFTWSDLNKPLFSALKVERNVMFIILSLIIIVAAFNIISGLTILVKNKTREIAILKSIGVSNLSIRKIFFFIGFLIGFLATIMGVVIGITFSLYIEEIRILISNIFNVSLFPEEIYFLSTIPYQIDFWSIFLISSCSIIMTCLVSIYPATKAAKLDTIKSLKYE